MKNVTRIREAVIRVQAHAFRRMTALLSMTEGGHECVDKAKPDDANVADMLQGCESDTLLARVVELILEDFGHATMVAVDDSTRTRSQAERAVARRGR